MTLDKGTRRKQSKSITSDDRGRAVRLVHEQQDAHPTHWAAIRSIAEKIGSNAETLRLWVRSAERETGKRVRISTDERGLSSQLERENQELKRANEILWKASAFFAAAELDRFTK